MERRGEGGGALGPPAPQGQGLLVVQVGVRKVVHLTRRRGPWGRRPGAMATAGSLGPSVSLLASACSATS